MERAATSRRVSLAASLAILLSIVTSDAQELVPDDASISANLKLWLRDAANSFDDVAGTWTDSSGNGNDATTIGEVNVTAPQTFVAPTLVTTSGGNFSVDDIPAVHFATDVNDLLGTPGLNGDAGMDSLTIFAVYNITTLGGNPNLTRPVGIGSIAATQANPGNHVNLSSDPSVRKDNGNVGAGQYTQAFPAGSLFIRTTRLSPAAIDEWFNTDGTLSNVLNVLGSSYITSVDRFYLGDLRGGAEPVPGFGPAISPSDFDIVQVLFYSAALSDEQIAGVNEWLGNNIASAVPGGGLAITTIDYNPNAAAATITWNSKPGREYAVFASANLSFWEELNDAVQSEGETTSFTESDLPDANGRFYRVEER